jgi:endonuclease YncB( thermonuclease family)
MMKYIRATQWFLIRLILACLVSDGGVLPAFAGDSLYGKVTEVRSAEVVVLDYGSGQYNVRIVGIDAPKQEPSASQAKQFVSQLVLGKNARIRFEYRDKTGAMVSRLFTDDPVIGIKEVGVELLRAGLVRRQPNYDYKYGELSAAEREARVAKRGLWSAIQP